MKKLTTAKNIKSWDRVITLGYCAAQHLLQGTEADYYTKGVYGWNSDNYIIDGYTIISTGYRPVNGIRPPHKIVEKYDKMAKGKTVAQRKALLNKMVKEVLANA